MPGCGGSGQFFTGPSAAHAFPVVCGTGAKREDGGESGPDADLEDEMEDEAGEGEEEEQDEDADLKVKRGAGPEKGGEDEGGGL